MAKSGSSPRDFEERRTMGPYAFMEIRAVGPAHCRQTLSRCGSHENGISPFLAAAAAAAAAACMTTVQTVGSSFPGCVFSTVTDSNLGDTLTSSGG